MQLDATLASFFAHVRDAQATRTMVLYKSSTALHQAQYELLEREYIGRVEFIHEFDFRRQVIDLLISTLPSIKLQRWYRLCQRYRFPPPIINSRLSYHPAGYILFLVDDNIFVDSFEIEKMVNALDMNFDALGFSLRLGTNTTYCYAMNTSQSLPGFELLSGQILKFNWTKSEGDFSYPLEVSSSIYSIKVVLDLIVRLKFHNPNTLEAQMSKHRSRYKRKFPTLLCYKNSLTFCTPINRVQNTYPNRAGQNEELSSQQSGRNVRKGLRIDVDALRGFVPNSCHQEVELKFHSK